MERKKPASLMSFTAKGKNRMQLWDIHKRKIASRLGVDFFEIKKNRNSILVLFYEKEKLHEKLEANRKYLQKFGYEKNNTCLEDLNQLKERFGEYCPHEIGIFLGIPMEDVQGFIQNRGENYMFNGYWKVYHNPDQAARLFEVFDLARVQVMKKLSLNTVLTEAIV